MTTLFREQAINQQLQRLHGEVVVLPRLSHSLIVLALVLVVAAAVSLLVMGSYARKETVRGWLEPASGVARVYAERSGIVRSIRVKPGDSVQRGDALLTVNGDQYLSDGRSLDATLLEELRQARDRLTDRISRTRLVQPLDEAKLRAEQDSTQQDIDLVRAQIEAVRQQQALVDKQLTHTRRLASEGHATEAQVDDGLAQRSRLESERTALERTLAQQENRLRQLKMDLDLLPTKQRDELDELDTWLSQLEQQILELEGRRGYTLTAPVSGRIASLQVEEGQRIPTAQPALVIVPKDATYEARIVLPVEASGFVETGQGVVIRYDAFPYQKFGSYHGQVTSISDTLMMPKELVNAPITPSAPIYQASLRLDRQSVQTYGQDTALAPGMTFQADVTLEERSLVEWMLEPLLSLKGRL